MGNVVGISKEGAEKIKAKIAEYQQYVYGKNYIQASSQQIRAAVRGTSVESQVSQMALAIQSEIDKTNRLILEFQKKMDTIIANYAKQDTSDTSITGVTKSIKS